MSAVDWAALRAAATEVAGRSYSPYSGFPVGAAGLCADGTVLVGTNVENASYVAGICAETALVGVLVAGGRGRGDLVAVAVTDLAPWKSFAPSVRHNGPEPADYTCAHCGEDFVSFARVCTRCESAPCPDCGRCGCDRKVPERQCTACFVVHPAAMFDGASSRCRDCD